MQSHTSRVSFRSQYRNGLNASIKLVTEISDGSSIRALAILLDTNTRTHSLATMGFTGQRNSNHSYQMMQASYHADIQT
jgi:hypothetical protein